MQIEQERRREGEGTTRSVCVSVPHHFPADLLQNCFAELSPLCSLRHTAKSEPS